MIGLIGEKTVYCRDLYSCKFCGSSNKLEPHYIVPLRINTLLIFSINNGISLCRQCHILTIRKEHIFEPLCMALVCIPAENKLDHKKILLQVLNCMPPDLVPDVFKHLIKHVPESNTPSQ